MYSIRSIKSIYKKLTFMKKDTINPVNELLVNNNGITLLEHSKLVSIVATEIAKQTLSSSEESIIENVRISALLHSIGKCCKVFQKDIKNPPKKERKVKFLYNEIGWSFITKYISSKSEFILDCVYWSNGIKDRTMGAYNNNNVLDTIDEEDKSIMLLFLKEILPSTYSYYPNDIKTNAPIYYSGSIKDVVTNSEKTFVRTCVISAEKLVYSLDINKFKELLYTQDINEIKRMITNLTKRHFYSDHALKLSFDEYDPKRLEIQKKIVELYKDEKTTIVKAPAGFGKSLLSVLCNLLYSSKKLIVVCPTNVISESTYLNTLKELQTLGVGDKVSMELYLTGKTKKTNGVNKENFIEFNSDIIVTNIDNFLSPSINSNNAERLFFINNCDVVFDEYHKLLCKEALFACFINIMNTRHRFTESRTLLVSATHVNINHLWDNLNKTKILPDENSHYPAAHKNKYKINTFVFESLDDFKTKSKSSSAVFINSIANAQRINHKTNSEILVHSRFNPNDREKIFLDIYKKFNKNSSRSLNKTNITATHVAQESLDVSFANIYESVLSPLTSYQRMGRCDRFGDYDNITEVNICKIKDAGENKMKEILYTKSLSDKWFDYISQYNGKSYYLDKWYVIYNEFNKINSVEINKYTELCFDKGMNYLSGIFPKHYVKNTKDKKFTAGANKLRSIGSEIFYICKVHNSNKYSEMFSDSNRGNLFDYNENEKTPTRIVKTRKEIMKSDDRFDYNIKQWNQSIIREEAKNSDTPYIRFDVVYHPEYGIIDKELLKEFIG